MRVPQSVAVFTLLVSMKATLSISARGRPHRPATSFVRSAKNLCIYASASSREYEMNNGGGICRSPIAASPSPTVKFDCYGVRVMPIQTHCRVHSSSVHPSDRLSLSSNQNSKRIYEQTGVNGGTSGIGSGGKRLVAVVNAPTTVCSSGAPLGGDAVLRKFPPSGER